MIVGIEIVPHERVVVSMDDRGKPSRRKASNWGTEDGVIKWAFDSYVDL